jgi:hypothetical protein
MIVMRGRFQHHRPDSGANLQKPSSVNLWVFTFDDGGRDVLDDATYARLLKILSPCYIELGLLTTPPKPNKKPPASLTNKHKLRLMIYLCSQFCFWHSFTASRHLTTHRDSSMCRKVIISISETVQNSVSVSACFSIETLLRIIAVVTIPIMELS